MDFLICWGGPLSSPGLRFDQSLENVKSKKEAVSEAKKIALQKMDGALVGLFARDGKAICGWKVTQGGKLKRENPKEIKDTFHVGPCTFDFVKRSAEEHDRVKQAEDDN